MPLAREHMSRDLLTVEPAERLGEVAERMVDRDVGAALVTEGTPVSDWMTRDRETMAPDEPTLHAAVLMIHGGFRHLPLVEGDEVVGMLSIRDLMRIVLDDAAPRGV